MRARPVKAVIEEVCADLFVGSVSAVRSPTRSAAASCSLSGKPELADERLGHALDDLRAAVVAVAADRTCVDAETKGCC